MKIAAFTVADVVAVDEAKDSKGNDGSGLTDELGQFQLEYNSPVFTLTGKCLRQMQDDLQYFWDRTDAAVGHFDRDFAHVTVR